QILGMPSQDRTFLHELSEKFIFILRGERNRMQATGEAIRGLVAYLSPLIEERLARPGDDLLSVLASGEKRGVYTREEVLANAVILLLAGHETTINLICNGTLAFLRHPAQWTLLQRDPALAVRATEECLRYDPPIKSVPRLAIQELELGGKMIRPLDRILWYITAANRDPEQFPTPDQFDITRDPNPHIAFGAGIHHCLGATLARI